MFHLRIGLTLTPRFPQHLEQSLETFKTFDYEFDFDFLTHDLKCEIYNSGTKLVSPKVVVKNRTRSRRQILSLPIVSGA